MLSGVRRTTNSAGSTSKAIVSMPKTTQVWRQPMVSSSQAATTGMHTFAKPTPMLVNASARPRRRTNHCGDHDIDDHRAHQRIAEGYHRQAECGELAESVDVPEDQIADTDNCRAHGHQPASAKAIDQSADKRREASADNSLAGAQQGKHAARDAEFGRQRFEKNTERARQGKRRGDVGKKSNADDVPSVKKPGSAANLRELRCGLH